MWTVYYDLPGGGSNRVELYSTAGRAVAGMYEAAADCGCFPEAYVRVPTASTLESLPVGGVYDVEYKIDGKVAATWRIMRVDE